jgi:hypothetical protein
MKPYVIWSEEHGAWWGPGKGGYTRSLLKAGRYSEALARGIVRNANQWCQNRSGFHEIAIIDPLSEVELVL